MSQLIDTYRGTVYPWQLDHMGHMNVMYYIGKFDEGTWHLFSHMGMTPQYLREQGRGMAAVRQEITYSRELRAGDIVAVRSGVVEIRERVLRFYHEMHDVHAGEPCAKVIITAVHIDTATRRACPFPPEVVEAASRLVIAEPPVL